jgi:flagellar motor switch protein FliG
VTDHPALLSRAAGAPPAPDRLVPRALSRREKAAVIVRLLLAEGAPLPLASLPEEVQAALTEQMSAMRLVDRETLAATVREFLTELDHVGLSFPGGLDGALGILDGHLSAAAAARLRRSLRSSTGADPWAEVARSEADALVPVLETESVEIGAVILSKLPVARAADLLGRLPGERARRIAHAMALTAQIDPDTVRRIGLAVLAQIEARPPRAFASGAVERVGAILNVSPAATRDQVLEGLAQDDAGFADQVRRAIFTFVHIPARLAPRDVPRVVRAVDQPALVTALAAAAAGPEAAAAAFILDNMSQRLSAALREEMAERGAVPAAAGEAAMAAVVTAIRTLEAAGELVLVQPEG